MAGDGYAIGVYLVYAVIAIGLTIWLARTLFASGQVFLDDVFEGKAGLAQAVNRLLVTGFYMLNLGYALYIIRSESGLDAFGAVEFLVNRLAILLVTLGAIHFVNVFVFWRIRAHRERADVPVAPQFVVADGGSA